MICAADFLCVSSETEFLQWMGEQDSLDSMWQCCERGDWMLMLVARVAKWPSHKSRRVLSECLAEIAKTSLGLISDDAERSYATGVIDGISCGETFVSPTISRSLGRSASEQHAKKSASLLAKTTHYRVEFSDAAGVSTESALALSMSVHRPIADDGVIDMENDTPVCPSEPHTKSDEYLSSLRQHADIIRQFYPKPPSMDEMFHPTLWVWKGGFVEFSEKSRPGHVDITTTPSGSLKTDEGGFSN